MEAPIISPEQAELKVRHALRNSRTCNETCNEVLKSALAGAIADDPAGYASKIAMAVEASGAAQQALSKLITDLEKWKSATVHAETESTKHAKEGIAQLENTISQTDQLRA
jgi:hypothetical protein